MIDYAHTDEWRIPVVPPMRHDRAVSQAAPPSVLPQAIIAQGQVTRREDRPAVVTTQALSWPGVMLESGKNNVTEADTVVLNQHFLSLNIDTSPLTLEVKGAHGFRSYTVPPQTVWICPAADPISLHVNSTFSYVRMSIDAPHLDRLLGRADGANPVRLRRMFGIAVPQITHLVKTLRAEADNQNPGGLAVVDAVTTALGHLLVQHVGIDQPRPSRLRGGLSSTASDTRGNSFAAGFATDDRHARARSRTLGGALLPRVQGDDGPGPASVFIVDAAREGEEAAGGAGCEPVGCRAQDGVRGSGALYSAVQTIVRDHTWGARAATSPVNCNSQLPVASWSYGLLSVLG